MMKKTCFLEDENALWLKGNLHSHSTFSDGCWTPEEMVEAYRRHGYDFLAITDHDVYVDTRHLSSETFTLLQGYELWANNPTNDKDIHLQFLWAGELEGISHLEKQSLRERTGKCCAERAYEMRRKGAYVMLNHPSWSYLDSMEVEDENPYHAIETLNYASEAHEGNGLSVIFWRNLLARGIRIFGAGGDDNHNGCSPIDNVDAFDGDSFGAWTVVKAKDRSDLAILEALKTGSFYASMGPEIRDFYVEGDEVHVRCSPCERILLGGHFRQHQRRVGKYLTEAVFRLKGTEKLVRVECMDAAGRTAYSNPIWLD